MADNTIDQIADAFRKVLSEGVPEGQAERLILIKRIPIICNDIIEMKTNIRWNTQITTGIAAGVGTLLILVLVAIITKTL